MDLIKLFMIFLIITIFSYCIYRLLGKRKSLMMQREFIESDNKESFTLFGNAAENELTMLQDTENVVGIVNILEGNAKLPLKEYVIKSSYNSAVTGLYLNLDMLRYVLSRGCRFLDFEVFSFDNKPYVAFSTDNNITNIDSLNKLLLVDVLSYIATHVFVAPCPNPNDPMFLHLRIKSMNSDLFDTVSEIIDKTIANKLHTCDVTPDTILSSLIGKIVLIIDKRTSPNYKSFASCDGAKDCTDLSTQVNIESGGDYLRLYRVSELLNMSILPPYIFADGTTDVNALRLVLPDNGTNVANPNIYEFIIDYGAQMVSYPFYSNDNNLKIYERLFRDNKSAFVPLSVMIPYLNKLNDSGEL